MATKRVKGWYALREALREAAEPDAYGWIEIWFDRNSGAIKCLDEGKGDELGDGFAKLELDCNKFVGYSVAGKIDSIKYAIARSYPEYADSVGWGHVKHIPCPNKMIFC